jgi:hypothetical protein
MGAIILCADNRLIGVANLRRTLLEVSYSIHFMNEEVKSIKL